MYKEVKQLTETEFDALPWVDVRLTCRRNFGNESKSEYTAKIELGQTAIKVPVTFTLTYKHFLLLATVFKWQAIPQTERVRMKYQASKGIFPKTGKDYYLIELVLSPERHTIGAWLGPYERIFVKSVPDLDALFIDRTVNVTQPAPLKDAAHA